MANWFDVTYWIAFVVYLTWIMTAVYARMPYGMAHSQAASYARVAWPFVLPAVLAMYVSSIAGLGAPWDPGRAGFLVVMATAWLGLRDQSEDRPKPLDQGKRD